jgi:hypothetical protein
MSLVSTGFNENVVELNNLIYGVKSTYQQKLIERKKDVDYIKGLDINQLRIEIGRIEGIVNRDNTFDSNILEQMKNISDKINKAINTSNKNIALAQDIEILGNKSKIGTLQGLARDTMERENLYPQSDDEIANDILEYWDKEEREKHGGKRRGKRSRKLRKTKRV